MLVMKRMTKALPLITPDWSTNTDAEIVEALRRHYDPEDPLDLTEIWSVGDTRTVPLGSLPRWEYNSDPTIEQKTHAAQDIELVLLNVGGKELTSSIGEHTECAFIVGMKYCLAENSTFGTRSEYLDNKYFNAQWDWSTSQRRTWCNTDFKNAIPSSIRSIFKEFWNVTGKYGTTDEGVGTADYFAFPSEKEVYGETYYATNTDENRNTQFTYYSYGSSNYVELDSSFNIREWWTRSRAVIDVNGQTPNYNYIVSVSEPREPGYGMISNDPSTGFGIRVFGVI